MTKASVEAVMSRAVCVLGRNDSLEAANSLMLRKGIRHLAIVDDGRLVGVLSERELLRASLGRAMGYGERGRSKLMQAILVKEVMSEPVIAVEPESSLEEAAGLMVEKKIGCLPVVAHGTLVGMLTTTDLLRYNWTQAPTQPIAKVVAQFR